MNDIGLKRFKWSWISGSCRLVFSSVPPGQKTHSKHYLILKQDVLLLAQFCNLCLFQLSVCVLTYCLVFKAIAIIILL